MQIKLGASVVASDGAQVGTVNRLVVDPKTRVLVELIVRHGRVETIDRLVKRELIAYVGVDGVVRLTLPAAELSKLPDFVQTNYVTPSTGWDSVLYPNTDFGGLDAGYGVGTAMSAVTPMVGSSGTYPGDFLSPSRYGDVNFETRSNLPEGVLIVERGTDVIDADDKKIGEIADVTYDAAGAITGFTVRGGFMGRKQANLPTTAVASAAPDRVQLSITAAEIGPLTDPPPTPSPIVVLAFEGEETADGMMDNFNDMESRGIISLDDAVIVSRGVGHDVVIRQTRTETGRYARRGSAAGLLAGLLLGGPIGGLAAGAAIGAIGGKLKDSGLDDDFVRGVSKALRSQSSALFLLVKAAEPEKVLQELRPYKAVVLQSTLDPERERKLREALAEEG